MPSNMKKLARKYTLDTIEKAFRMFFIVLSICLPTIDLYQMPTQLKLIFRLDKKKIISQFLLVINMQYQYID